MSEKKKKWLVIAGLLVVCIGLVFGISRVLYHEPEKEVQTANVDPTDVDTVIDIEVPEEQPQESAEQEVTEPEIELVIETDTGTAVDNTEQEIQKEPEKTEDTKPREPPEIQDGADAENPAQPPIYEEPKEENTSQPQNSTPSNGDTKDGMIYVEGFGWVPNEGGGASGTTADDMYENGNKIGIMD